MVFAMWSESGVYIFCEKSHEGVEFGVAKVPVSLQPVGLPSEPTQKTPRVIGVDFGRREIATASTDRAWNGNQLQNVTKLLLLEYP